MLCLLDQDELLGMMDDAESDEEQGTGLRVRLGQPDPAIDTSRVEEIPTREPKFNAVPLKSALKKRGGSGGAGSGPGTPTQEGRPLGQRQEGLHCSFK